MSVRNNPFARNNAQPQQQGPNAHGLGRPRSAVFNTNAAAPMMPGAGPGVGAAPPTPPTHIRSLSHASSQPILVQPTPIRPGQKSSLPQSTTFAPSFIKTEDMRKHADIVKGIEGEDFSGKKYVWLKDPQTAFVKGWVVEELPENKLLVQCDDGSVSRTPLSWPYQGAMQCSIN